MGSTEFVMLAFLTTWLLLASPANSLFWQDLDGARPALPGDNQQPLDSPPEVRPSFQHPQLPLPPVSHPQPNPYYPYPAYGYGSNPYDPYHPFDPVQEHPHHDVHDYHPYGHYPHAPHNYPYGHMPGYPHGYYPPVPLPPPYPGLYPPLVHQPYPTHTGYQPYEGAGK